MAVDAKVKIMLDKERTLLLDFNALCKYEETTGKSAFEYGAPPKATETRLMLWVALLDESPDITLEEAGKLMFGGNLAYLSEKLGEALMAGNPEKVEAEDSPKDLSRSIG